MKSTRIQILIFLLLVFIVSWSFEAFIISGGGVKNFGLLGLMTLMWIPGLISTFLRIIAKLGFEDVGFKKGPAKFYYYAVGLPLVIALVVNIVCMVLDIRDFSFIAIETLNQALPKIAMTLVLGLFGALGEELGWRGFLLPKMHEAKISSPYLWSGLIWALWHLPIVVFGNYYTHGSPPLIALAYVLSIVAINFVISDFRDSSDSLWVAVVFHAAHNFLFQLAIPYLIFTKPGSRIELWETIGADCGFLVAAGYTISYLFIRQRRQAT